jgi:hypothetical protein
LCSLRTTFLTRNCNLNMHLLFVNILEHRFPARRTTRGQIKISLHIIVQFDSDSIISPCWKNLLFRLEESICPIQTNTIFLLYTIIVKDNFGIGQPVCYFFVREEIRERIKLGLTYVPKVVFHIFLISSN